MNKKVQEELFRKLYDQTYTGLRRFVQYRSRNLHMTDDILQEIYLEMFRHIDELAVHQNQIGWIYKTAEFKIMKLNEVYDRNASRELGNPDFTEPLTDDDTEGIVQLEEYRGILKEDELALVMKRYIEGYSYKEIGQMTGNTESGSKMKIMRLITKLRKNIRDNVILMISFVISFFRLKKYFLIPTYIPNGFEPMPIHMQKTTVDNIGISRQYINGEFHIRFLARTVGEYGKVLHSEDQYAELSEEKEINGKTVSLYQTEDEMQAMFQDGQYVYILEADISEEEITKIIEEMR